MFQAVTALTAVAALLFTARSLDLTADATKATRDQVDLAAQGQVVERFSQAIDQLGQTGPDKLSIRLGGIYSLERLMRDSPDDEPTVIAVLCAFVRTNARRPDKEVEPSKLPAATEDIRAAITVLARRPNPKYHQHVRLDFTGAQLSLPGISLEGGQLEAADLSGANLNRASLGGADLSFTKLGGADLRDGDLMVANLSYADLSNANLSGTYLRGANLSYANLSNANLYGAYLNGANLSTAQHLTTEMVRCSYVSDQTQLPPGVIPPAVFPLDAPPAC